ncbi:hypothetical protein FDN13_04865 [Caloramator sp. E03]|uniref:hypothetical protein n=1 Tax=Caloramator sp. E03 TaxID=2576307 RepID=UPI001110F297|nr:hypothetical protein [Caloramator sp. E03]QCX33086.1 hypothetical protein FDN13_04865 [Caloramator sp. E03]
MEYHQDTQKEELINSALKLCCISIDNIKWGLLYSGAGIYQSIEEKEFKKIVNSFDVNYESKDLIDNIVLLKCSYKKGKPFLPFVDSNSSGKYVWDSNSFNKTIYPLAQSFSILSLLKAMDLLKSQDSLLSYLMHLTAQNFYDFATTYMRNEDGLFIAVEDKTRNINDELKIKTIQKEAKIIDQILMHEALLYLYNSSLAYNSDTPSIERYKIEKDNLFNFIFENCNQILEMSSKEISLIISSLSRCYDITRNDEEKTKYHLLVFLLCAELESRIKITGEIQRSCLDTIISSIITHFRALSALLEGYHITRMENFKDAAIRIYNTLLDLYDPYYSLFIQGNYSKISYSIRDIAEIIKSLLLVYISTQDEKALKILNDFYTFTIENSSIIPSISQRKTNFMNYEVTMPEIIPNTLDVYKAPVFIKSFRVSCRKTPPTITPSKSYNSIYSTYSSYIFLYYLSKIIEPKKSIEEILNESTEDNSNI